MIVFDAVNVSLELPTTASDERIGVFGAIVLSPNISTRVYNNLRKLRKF